MTANDVYNAIKQGDIPKANCVNYVWKWKLYGKSVTRQMNTLKKQNRIQFTYLRNDSVAISIND